ncbi:hypothetical protein EVAR_92026_1 [Eumeta japonica]|uniref:Uncharacterized protein n=1 Tax=Eumeta variegata TaxID=151549 RepID=A0A4C1ZE78_EUMVA|nr:hypothetical protein EVAR_92026_1 [Eumeta japonica]
MPRPMKKIATPWVQFLGKPVGKKFCEKRFVPIPIKGLREDILGDDLGDQSLADYNLGNEEEEQLLADDYDNASSQNVPGRGYRDNPEVVDYSHRVEYTRQVSLESYQTVDSECVVPNVTIEVTHSGVPTEHHANYATYGEMPVYEQEQHGVVPPAIPAAPMESPQIVPSEMPPHGVTNMENMSRERFPSERPPGVQRTPQVRDIPDSLELWMLTKSALEDETKKLYGATKRNNVNKKHVDWCNFKVRNVVGEVEENKVYIPRPGFGRGQRTTWRNPQYQPRHSHPYRRHYVNRGHFLQQQTKRPSFSPQTQIRSSPPHLRPEPPQIRPETSLIRPETSHIRLEAPQLPSEPAEQPIIPPELPPITGPALFRPMSPQNIERSPFQPNPSFPQRFPGVPPMQNLPNFRPEVSPPRPSFPPNVRTPFDPRPQIPFQFHQRPQFNPRPQFPLPAREIVPNSINHMPQVTIRQAVPLNVPPGVPPLNAPPKMEEFPPKLANRPPEYNPREPEVRMLPVQLPTSLPPGGLAGKKVLINPHFKGNFQPPVEGPVQNVDDAAERFIAEQRNALARAATRKYPRRSPQRYIENTTIEIENELARGDRPRRDNDDADLLRRQEEFINANRAGLRRRMRSPSPVARRSPSPRRSLSPRRRLSPLRHHEPLDEEGEYRRRLREQESLRERVLRAKEVRRKKNAVALQKQIQDRERERQQQSETIMEKQSETDKDRENRPKEQDNKKVEMEREPPPRDRSPLKQKIETEQVKEKEVIDQKLTENLTPPRKVSKEVEVKRSPERALTPPLPAPDVIQKRRESKEKVENKSGKIDESILDFEDDLDLLLGDIDGILSDDEDTGRFKEKPSNWSATFNEGLPEGDSALDYSRPTMAVRIATGAVTHIGGSEGFAIGR